MEHLCIEDIKVGMTRDFSTVVTQEKVDLFTKCSGDVNPLHLDDKYAKQHGFSSHVVYGMLTASLYSTLCGVHIPGERCLLYSVDVKFTKPVFVGDVLTVIGTVTEVNEIHSYIRIKAYVKNQLNEVVSRAKIMAGVLKDEK